MQDNTVGSRPKTDYAYIAGFLDGDGSLMFQLKKRKDTERGWRLMATIAFYQDTRHAKPLIWIKKRLGIGYISQRNDGITELRINGFGSVARVLSLLIPYIKFKKPQAAAISKACKILENKNISALSGSEKKQLSNFISKVQENNYATRRKKTVGEVKKILGLTP